ncbi:MAG: MFS transporter [Ignavibacteriae bacterium]|nr:MFS transporter [Ignavibacteriota bacterium]
MKVITPTILLLSAVSLLTDISSEMLYPIMPVYLQSIGFSALLIGILEGIAEATAGLSKGYFGKLSDSYQRRLPFVQFGYGLSALSKLMLGLYAATGWVFAARTVDRLGKGIRTSARDALLSSETIPEHKGKVFGFHRSADTVGAALGPIFAIIYLYYYPAQYSTLFIIAFIPGVLGAFVTFLIKEKGAATTPRAKTIPGFFSFLRYWKDSPSDFRAVAFGLIFFAIINSSDLFILLMIKYRGASDLRVIQAYILYNLVYALAAYPFGIIADKLGLKRMFMFGIGVFVIVYAGMAFTGNYIVICCMLALYGIYAAATEGVSKAWVTNIVPKEQAATAIGFINGVSSIASLVSSALAGLLWSAISPEVPFYVTACGAIVVLFYFMIRFRRVRLVK